MYSIGDTVISKKIHPCGGNEWTVVRIGADIKLKCNKCGHVVMIDLNNMKKITKKLIPLDNNSNALLLNGADYEEKFR